MRRVRYLLGAVMALSLCSFILTQSASARSVVPLGTGAPPLISVAAVVHQAPATFRYRVMAGDTLSTIGVRYNTNWQALASDNHLSNPDLIYVGQILQVTRGRFLAGGHFPHTSSYQGNIPKSGSASPGVSYQAPASGSFQACVEWRESTNGQLSSDLYGILPSIAADYGLPNPYTASPGEQAHEFQVIYSAVGASAWAPYDGC